MWQVTIVNDDNIDDNDDNIQIKTYCLLIKGLFNNTLFCWY
jgi:hypothetical protein